MARAREVVALLSGGLDSGTALALSVEAGDRVRLCLCCDYGQRAAAREAGASRRLAQRYGIDWECIDLPWLGAAAARAGTALVPGGPDLPEREVADPGDERSAAAVWVPARNVVLIAAAAAWAEALSCGAVLVGFNREEAATFADNSAEFAAALDAVLELGTRSGVRVVSPTQEMDKRAIAGEARRLGLGPADFWSCYAGADQPCGRCESCVRSLRAWN